MVKGKEGSIGFGCALLFLLPLHEKNPLAGGTEGPQRRALSRLSRYQHAILISSPFRLRTIERERLRQSRPLEDSGAGGGARSQLQLDIRDPRFPNR